MAGNSRTQNIKDKVEDTAQSAKETASSIGHKAADLASSVASTVGQSARDLGSAAADRADQGVAAVGSGMSSLADTVRERAPHEGMLGSAAGAVARGLETGGEYLQEHGLADIGSDLGGLIRRYPVASLMVVFGLGYLLGSRR